MFNNPNLHNPHLEGGPFFWKAGPVGIFLAHGFTATTAEIRPLAENLHAQGYTVAGPLLPGHGTTPQDLNRVRWQDWVQAGNKTCQDLFNQCDRVLVGGHSMGGVLALYLASQNPQLSGVLLSAPALRLTLSTLDKIKLTLGAIFLSEVPRTSLDGSEQWQGYPGLPLKGAIQLLRFEAATLPRLNKIYQPVLVLQGRQDTTVAPEAGNIILSGVSSTIKEHHWLEKSNHAIPIGPEQSRLAEITLTFIAKCLETQPKGIPSQS